jgi:hypothetical protein
LGRDAISAATDGSTLLADTASINKRSDQQHTAQA